MPTTRGIIFPKGGFNEIGGVVNLYPYKDQQNRIIGHGGSWLVIKFPPHNDDGMIVAKISYGGSTETSVTSAMGIVPGGHNFFKDYVGLAMCMKIQ